MPACLVRILLLRAGIESNPGPITYYCSVCSLILHRNSPSVQCTKCSEWVHFRKVNNCSRLIKKKEWPTYICPTCLHDPFPIQPAPPHHPRRSLPPPPLQNTQHPTPNFDNYNMMIMQWNCNGIGNKLHDLTQFVHENNIKIIALQETKLNANSKPPTIPNFTLIRQDKERDM